MDKDKTLNNEKKIILLICGDSKTGKKTLVNNWLKEIEYKEKDYTFYKEYIFSIEEIIDEKKENILIEIRILNSDELESDSKINSSFFKNAYGGFIINSIDNEQSFINGEKFKEKIDFMCTLRNKFPLPIFLIINKCDLFNFDNPEFDFQKENNIEQYYLENQFISKFYIISIDGDFEKNNNLSEINLPFINMIKLIFQFEDIKNEFFKSSNQKINKNQNNKKGEKCVTF